MKKKTGRNGEKNNNNFSCHQIHKFSIIFDKILVIEMISCASYHFKIETENWQFNRIASHGDDCFWFIWFVVFKKSRL